MTPPLKTSAERILSHVRANAGCTLSQIYKALGTRSGSKTRTIEKLVASGQLIEVITPRGRTYRCDGPTNDVQVEEHCVMLLSEWVADYRDSKRLEPPLCHSGVIITQREVDYARAIFDLVGGCFCGKCPQLCGNYALDLKITQGVYK